MCGRFWSVIRSQIVTKLSRFLKIKKLKKLEKTKWYWNYPQRCQSKIGGIDRIWTPKSLRTGIPCGWNGEPRSVTILASTSIKNWQNWQNLDPKIPQNWNSLWLEWGTTLRNHPGVDVDQILAEFVTPKSSKLEFHVAGVGTTLRNHPGVDVDQKLAELAESVNPKILKTGIPCGWITRLH